MCINKNLTIGVSQIKTAGKKIFSYYVEEYSSYTKAIAEYNNRQAARKRKDS